MVPKVRLAEPNKASLANDSCSLTPSKWTGSSQVAPPLKMELRNKPDAISMHAQYQKIALAGMRNVEKILVDPDVEKINNRPLHSQDRQPSARASTSAAMLVDAGAPSVLSTWSMSRFSWARVTGEALRTTP